MIKYRVWDTVTKEYLDKSAVSINGHGDLAVFGATNIPVVRQPLSTSSPRFIIEQYTGLKDKNGVEIAAGDILMDDTGQPVEYWTVSFSDGSFIGECAGVSEGIFELTSLEVIGNIHENAELLEEK